jgi:triosephosphate isomerase
MTKFLIVANWKANVVEAKKWLQQFSIFNFQFSNKIEVAIAAPYPLIDTIDQPFVRAAQDVSAFDAGAYTGEVPARVLAELGVKYTLVGHSERRKYLQETNATVEAKMKQAMQNGITPILCAQSLEEIPENIRNFPPDRYLVMYEPFTAISTGGQYHPESVENIVATLTDWKNKFNLGCRFLYGGSVNPDYVAELVTSLVTGLVVGHASLDMETFAAIIKKCLLVLP